MNAQHMQEEELCRFLNTSNQKQDSFRGDIGY